MIKCPSCQKRHPENTLFCDECGAYLLAKGRKRTDPLTMEDVAWMETDFPSPEEEGEDSSRPMTLRIWVVDSGRRVEFPLTKEISLGRLDAASATFPDIDLTTDGGLEKGVSRRHARITRHGGEVFIEDLGSVNGTFLNGKRLTPYLPHSLRSGDEIQLGKLIIRVSFS